MVQDLLGREIRTLRQTSGVHLTLKLKRAGGSTPGLVLTRRGKDPVHARPLKDPGIVLEVANPESFRSLEDALRDAGLDPREPRVSNALLAARINGFDDETLAALLGPEGRLACLCPEGCGAVRLLFSPDDLGLPRPPRVVMEEGREVLEVNLAAVRAVADGGLDFLLIGQEPAGTRGIHLAEHEALLGEAEEQGVADRVQRTRQMFP